MTGDVSCDLPAPPIDHEQLPSVAWLSNETRVDPEHFGWKATNLGASAAILSRTPEGFAVSRTLVTRIAKGTATGPELAKIERAWASLVVACPKSSFIVRSSSSIEHARTNSFAGLFVTVRDVSTFDGLIAAIRRCHESTYAPRVLRYAALRGEQLPGEHMAVLVQRQIRIRYAALVQVTKNGYLFEAYEGDLAQPIHGHSAPEHVVSFRNGRTTVLRGSAHIPRAFFHEIRNISNDLQQVVANGSSFTECLLEVASDGDRVYVLQLNLIGVHEALSVREPSLTLDVRGTVLQGEAETLGVKAAAMNYFCRSGLFELPLWIYPPGTPIDVIREQVSQSSRTEGYTVRYSHTGDLGLPRSFQPDYRSIVRWVHESRKEHWTTIIHPYINVKHSFEMLLSGDSLLMEHVPGTWESDNNLDPDVVIVRDGRARVWISNSFKNAVFATPQGLTEEEVAPTPFLQIRGWAEQASCVVDLLRRDLGSAGPLNVHFVEDAKQQWFFLNVRRGFGLEDVAVSADEPFVVCNVSDLDRWNRHSPILLRITTQRGTENRVIDIAERLLHHRGMPILIDFGLLSHPALILRELGFTLVPTYLHAGSRLSSPSYRTYEWSLDRDDDPIKRIRREAALYADEWVRVVSDRDPIVSGHLLVVAQQDVKSFADSGATKSLEQLLNSQIPGLQPGPWIFVERGRASFCTSGFTTSHAHGHLLPEGQFKEHTSDAFAADIGATRYDSLEDALEAARRCSGEYTLTVTSHGSAYVCAMPVGRSFEKRRIRNFFAGRIR